MLSSSRRKLSWLFAALVISSGSVQGSPAIAQVMLPTLTSYLRVDVATESKGGRMRLTGYVYNTWDKWATDVRLLVDALDASGQVVGSMPVSVYGKCRRAAARTGTCRSRFQDRAIA